MSMTDRIVLSCTCEGTMAPDGAALARAGCGGEAAAHLLCRAGLERFRAEAETWVRLAAHPNVICTPHIGVLPPPPPPPRPPYLLAPV